MSECSKECCFQNNGVCWFACKDKFYQQGRADKYQEITSEYMILTEKQVEEIRADAIEEFKNFIRNNKHYFVGDMAEMLIYEFEQMQLKEPNND